MICVLSLVGCQTIASDGAGYEQLTPKPKTVSYVKHNDPVFLRQVAGHIKQCKSDKGCAK